MNLSTPLQPWPLFNNYSV